MFNDFEMNSFGQILQAGIEILPEEEKERIKAKGETFLAIYRRIRDAFTNGEEITITAEETTELQKLIFIAVNFNLADIRSAKDFQVLVQRASLKILDLDNKSLAAVTEEMENKRAQMISIPPPAMTAAQEVLEHDSKEYVILTGETLEEIVSQLNALESHEEKDIFPKGDIQFLEGKFTQLVLVITWKEVSV